MYDAGSREQRSWSCPWGLRMYIEHKVFAISKGTTGGW
jgi:hypothetical protein